VLATSFSEGLTTSIICLGIMIEGSQSSPHCLIFPPTVYGQCTHYNCVGAATDSRQLLDSKVHSSLVVAYSRVHHTRVGRSLL